MDTLGGWRLVRLIVGECTCRGGELRLSRVGARVWLGCEVLVVAWSVSVLVTARPWLQ